MGSRRSSAVPLAWLYAALIAYASLYPFAGWRSTGALLFGFVVQPWTRWWTWFDVIANFIGYLPLGALVFGARVRSGARAGSALRFALLAGAALSFALETIQGFVPARVPSTMDWVINSAGATAGAAIGLAVHAAGGTGRWQAVRDRWFVEHSAGGLVLLLVWPAALLFPTPFPLGLGQVLGELQAVLAGWVEGTAVQGWAEDWLRPDPSWVALSAATETVAIALGLLTPAMVAASVSQPGWRRAALLLATAMVAIGATTLSTALNFGPGHAWAWLTPTASAGVVGGAVVALLLAWVHVRVAAALGLVAVSALIALVAQAPADPYVTQIQQAWEQGRFIRFHGASQWVGWFWPYAVLVYLLARIASRRPD